VERGGEQYALYLVDQEKDAVLGLAETTFAAIPLEGGWFWLLRPNYGENTFPSFGLVDESSKLNLNSATNDMLLKLPGMTDEIAGAIADWRDGDSDVGSNGAEDDYYLSLPQPYHAKNAPLETVEEVLLVKGMTPELLYGTGLGSRYGGDARWSGALSVAATTDLQLARGIFDLITVYSSEPSTGGSGTGGGAGGGTGGGTGGKVDVNDENREPLLSLLQELLGNSRGEDVWELSRPRPPFRDIFDFAVRTTLKSSELDTLSARITAGTRPSGTGLINVNTAPREVLLCLPGLTDADATTMISSRASAVGALGGSTGGSTTASGASGGGSISWVLDALGPKAVGLGNLITSRSYQYSADVLAVSEDGKAFRRCRIVIDAKSSPPVIVHRRDLTQAGWPLDPMVLLSLRQGRGLPANATSAGVVP
jgi:DNA uptake protein ComE-like DNA-binding protein